MTTWFTSDWHIGHKNILRFCDRPFKDLEAMQETLVRNFNEVVADDDETFFLGDVVMGGWRQNLPVVSTLNGRKTLVVGNHDKPFTVKDPTRLSEVIAIYREHFDKVVTDNVMFEGWVLSHFPYSEDRLDRKFTVPEDRGVPIVHGHTHDKDVFSLSPDGTPQVHVGVDAWGFAPVSQQQVEALLALDTPPAAGGEE